MPTRCAAPGCTSGYDSNKEQIHFFFVPKDPERARLWQEASKRMDISLKSRAFCEKHFRNEDIVWKKNFFDKDGKLIQEVLLKKPHLKKDVVPSLFPWSEFPEKVEENLLSEESIIEDNLPTKVDKGHCDITFDMLENMEFELPQKWQKYILCDGKNKLIFYSKLIPKLQNEALIIEKQFEIKVTSELEIKVRVLDNEINSNLYGFKKKKLSSIQLLQDFISFLDSKSACQGYLCSNEEIQTSVAYKQNNVLRHKDCQILLDGKEICKNCTALKFIIKRKKERLKKGLKRLRTDSMLPSQERKLNELRKKREIHRETIIAKRKSYSNIETRHTFGLSENERDA